MAIAFNCSACAAPMKVGDNLAGKKVKCPKCAAVNVVPTGEEEAAAAGIATEPDAADDADEGGKAKKGKKVKGKKGKKGLMILGVLAVLGLGFFCCAGGGGGGFAIWYFWFSSPDEMKFLPNGTQFVTSARVGDLRDSQFYKDISAELKDKDEYAHLEKQRGVPVTNVKRLVEATSRGATPEHITVIRTKDKVQAADIVSKLKQNDSKVEFTEAKAGKYTMNEPKNSATGVQAFAVVDSKTVVYGDAKALRAVLERDKTPELSSTMQTAMGKADFSKAMVSVTDLSVDATFSAQGPVGIGMLGSTKGSLKSGEYTVQEIAVDKEMKIRALTSYKDAAAAEAAKKETDQGMEIAKQMSPQFKDMIAEMQYKATVSGNTLVVESRMTSAMLLKMQKGFK